MKGNHASLKPVVEKNLQMVPSDVEAGNSPSSVSKMTPYVTDRKKLIVCFLGIFISYFYYGIIQEKM